MSTVAPEPYAEVDVVAGGGPYPGRESRGPVPLDFVVATRDALRAELSLYRQAQAESRERMFELTKQGQADANGDLLLELFQVPGGSTGHLTRCVVQDGTTPAAPTTSANLWLAILALSSAGITTPPVANAYPVGSLLHCSPTSPAADAQIPCNLVDAENPESAPTLVGPATFYLQVDAGLASSRIAVRFCVLTRTPEP
jgi:hypothetical protein